MTILELDFDWMRELWVETFDIEELLSVRVKFLWKILSTEIRD